MYFIAYVDRVNISVAAPTMRQEIGLTPTELGLIFSAFAYPYAAMQIVGGWMADRFGPRLVLAVLSLLWAAATILTGLSWSVASLVGFRIARRRRRRRRVSCGHARVDLLAAGSRARLRAGHHPQLRAPGRRGDAADRPRDRGEIRMARVVRRARRGEPGVDGGVAGVLQEHAAKSTRGSPARSWRTIRGGGGSTRGGARTDAVAADRQPHVARHRGRLLLWMVAVGLPDLAAVVSVGCPRVQARSDCADDDAAAARRRGGRHAGRRDLGRDLPAHRQPPAGAADAARRRPRRSVRIHASRRSSPAARSAPSTCSRRRSSSSS